MSLQTTLGKTRRTTDAIVNLSTTTDSIFCIVGPIRVHRAGIHVTTAKTTGTAGVITLQSVAGTTETSKGTMTTPDTMAAGATLYKNFDTPIDIAEGAMFKAEVTTAANTGQGYLWVEYEDRPMTKEALSDLTALT